MQSYIAFFTILYSSTNAPIHLYREHYARAPLHYSYLLPSKIEVFRLRSSKEKSASCEELALCNDLIR